MTGRTIVWTVLSFAGFTRLASAADNTPATGGDIGLAVIILVVFGIVIASFATHEITSEIRAAAQILSASKDPKPSGQHDPNKKD